MWAGHSSGLVRIEREGLQLFEMEQEVEVLSMDESYHRVGEVLPKGLSKPYLVPVVFDKDEVGDVPMQIDGEGEHKSC